MKSAMRQWINLFEATIFGYHGSSERQPAFVASHTGDNSMTFGAYQSTRHGIFFSDNPKFAALYGKVQRYRLNVRQTLDLGARSGWDVIATFVDSFDPFGPDRALWLTAKEILSQMSQAGSFFQPWHLFEAEVGGRFVAFLKDQGFDSGTFVEGNEDDEGDWVQSHTVVVFDPGQVTPIPDTDSEGLSEVVATRRPSQWRLVPIDDLPKATQDDIFGWIAERVQPELFEQDPSYVRDNMLGLVDPPKVWLGRLPVTSLLPSMQRDNSIAAVNRYRDMLNSLRDFDPILTSHGRFLDGGHRLEAYAKAGRAMIPVVDIGHLVDAPRELWQDWIDGQSVSLAPSRAPAIPQT